MKTGAMKSLGNFNQHVIILPHRGIQLYARVSELIPTEPPIIDGRDVIKFAGRDFWESAAKEALSPPSNDKMYASDYYPRFLKDLEKNSGVPRHQLHVHPSGIIGDGNFRYHWARWAGLEFLPVDLDYFLCDTTHDFKKAVIARGVKEKIETFQHPVRYIIMEGHSKWFYPEARMMLGDLVREGTPPFNLTYEEVKRRKEKK